MAECSSEQIAARIEVRGMKPTANRIIVLKALMGAVRPLSLSDLFEGIGTMDRSSIFRALSLFLEYDLVHAIDDGSGSLKYECCKGDGHSVYDMHAHFHCEVCGCTYCLHDVVVPLAALPPGFMMHSVNYVVKGICDTCRKDGLKQDKDE